MKVINKIGFIWLCLQAHCALGQTFYATSGPAIYEVNVGNCTSELLVNLPAPFDILYDIAIDPVNPDLLYGSSESGLCTINLTNGDVSLFPTTPNYLGSVALVAASNELLYYMNGSILSSVNLSNGQLTPIGDVGMYAAGDLTFFGGDLYMAESQGELVIIENPGASGVNLGYMGVEIYGIITVNSSTSCNDAANSQLIALSLNDVYSVNPSNGQIALLCQDILPNDVLFYGGASAWEVQQVFDAPSPELSVDLSDYICESDDVGLTLENMGDFASFTWSNGAQSQSILVSPSEGTNLSLALESFQGCEATFSYDLDELVEGAISEYSIHPDCESACNGAAGVETLADASSFQIVWNTNSSDLIIDQLCAGTYDYTLTSQSGCEVNGSIILEAETFEISAVVPEAICENTTAILNFLAIQGTNYQDVYWVVNDQTYQSSQVSIVVESNLEVELFIEVNDQCTQSQEYEIIIVPTEAIVLSEWDTWACPGEWMEIEVLNPNAYESILWSNGETDSVISYDPALMPSVWLQAEVDNGCVLTEWIDVISISDPMNVFDWFDTNCNEPCGVEIQVLVEDDAYFNSIQWSDGSSAFNRFGLCAGDYTYELTSEMGCVIAETVHIEETNLVVSLVNYLEVCAGQSNAINATVMGGTEPYIFNWSGVASENNVAELSTTEDTNISLEIIDAAGCQVSDSLVVHVHDIPDVDLFIDDAQLCIGDCVNFSVASDGVNTSEIHIGSVVLDSDELTWCSDTIGDLPVTMLVTYAQGCTFYFDESQMIEISNVPQGEIETSFDYDNSGNGIMVHHTLLTNEEDLTWFWISLNDSLPFDNWDEISYLVDNGDIVNMDVHLVNQLGCSSYVYEVVPIDLPFSLHIPNAITADHDGVNDVWRPVIWPEGGHEMTFRIFNRYGEQVFDSKANGPVWVGGQSDYYNQNGAYTYQVFVTDYAGRVHEFRGHISVIR